MSKPIILYLKKYAYVLGIFLFIFILTKTDLKTIGANIKNADPFYLLLAPLLSFPLILVKSYCWNYIKRKQNIIYSIKDSFLMFGAGIFIGGFTPGKIGELSRAIYLKKDGYSLGKSLVSLILDRLSDFFFLLVFIFFGSLFIFDLSFQEILFAVLALLLFIFLVFLFCKSNLTKRWPQKLFYFFVPGQYQKSWKTNFQDFIQGIKIYSFRDYLIIFLITAFSWSFYYIQMYLIALSVNIANIPLLHLSVILTVIGFITLIPVSISGLGTRDAALIFFLVPFSIDTERIIAFSTLILSIYLFTSLIGVVCWLIKPIQLFKTTG